MKSVLAMAVVAICLSSPTVLAQTPALYWLDGTGIVHRMDLETRQTETAFQIQLGSTYDPQHADIAVDAESGHMYWADRTPPDGWFLLRSDLSGSSIDTVYSSALAPPPSTGVCIRPHQLALDIPNNKFYWTFSIWGPDGICRADLTTGDTEQIIPAGNTAGIAVDSEGGKVYFSKPQQMIIRCNLDGSDPDTLATNVGSPGATFGVDVAVDTIHDVLYWAADDAVWRSDLDGSNAGKVVSGEFYWLAVDGPSDSIFMTDSTGIYRSDLNGVGLERIVEQSWPGHLALYRPSVGTGTESMDEHHRAFRLSQNHPNPFNLTTTITYTLQQPVAVRLTLYDVLGRQIRDLVSATNLAGTYEVSLDASGLTTGVYLYSLQAGDRVETRRMVLVR